MGTKASNLTDSEKQELNNLYDIYLDFNLRMTRSEYLRMKELEQKGQLK